jgi:hypothetical protein
MFIRSVRTSQETRCVSATEPNRLMLSVETVAVYCENHTEHTDTVCTSQETRCVSATEPNRSVLSVETVAVYCENHTEHTDTVRTSQETRCVSATEPNRSVLSVETVVVYCENHTEHTDKSVPHRTHITSPLETNRLTLFKETFPVYCENHKKPINRLYGQYAGLFSVQARGTHSNHYVLNDQLDYSKHITHSLTSVVGSGAGTRVKYTPLPVSSLRSALH